MRNDDSLTPIPGLGHQDAAVVQALLKGAGFFCNVAEGFGEYPDVVSIRASDLPTTSAGKAQQATAQSESAKPPDSAERNARFDKQTQRATKRH
jgi:hypothetical protein